MRDKGLVLLLTFQKKKKKKEDALDTNSAYEINH